MPPIWYPVRSTENMSWSIMVIWVESRSLSPSRRHTLQRRHEESTTASRSSQRNDSVAASRYFRMSFCASTSSRSDCAAANDPKHFGKERA